MLMVLVSPFMPAPVPTLVPLMSPFLPHELHLTSSGVPVACRELPSAAGASQQTDFGNEGMLLCDNCMLQSSFVLLCSTSEKTVDRDTIALPGTARARC